VDDPRGCGRNSLLGAFCGLLSHVHGHVRDHGAGGRLPRRGRLSAPAGRDGLGVLGHTPTRGHDHRWLARGSRGPLISKIALRTFRGPQSTTIFGMITIGSGVGSALGAWLGGFLHDLSGSYEPVMAFAVLGIACAVVPFFTITVLRSAEA